MVCLVNFNKNIIYLVPSTLSSTKRVSSMLMRKRKRGFFLPLKAFVSRFTFPRRNKQHIKQADLLLKSLLPASPSFVLKLVKARASVSPERDKLVFKRNKKWTI